MGPHQRRRPSREQEADADQSCEARVWLGHMALNVGFGKDRLAWCSTADPDGRALRGHSGTPRNGWSLFRRFRMLLPKHARPAPTPAVTKAMESRKIEICVLDSAEAVA